MLKGKKGPKDIRSEGKSNSITNVCIFHQNQISVTMMSLADFIKIIDGE
jgi:hypothetical protein